MKFYGKNSNTTVLRRRRIYYSYPTTTIVSNPNTAPRPRYKWFCSGNINNHRNKDILQEIFGKYLSASWQQRNACINIVTSPRTHTHHTPLHRLAKRAESRYKKTEIITTPINNSTTSTDQKNKRRKEKYRQTNEKKRTFPLGW